MRRWIIPFIIFTLISCEERTDSYLTPDKASQYFRDIENICNTDSGRLWGKNLYGPIIFIDRSSRNIISNQPDEDGILKERNGVYTGYYPKELIINNSYITFGETIFAMTPLPRREDKYRIYTGAIHSLFHLSLFNEGIPEMNYNTSNMDGKEARLWIKLEWKALKNAITAEGEEKLIAIRDALIFKGSNREFYSKYRDDENRFEAYEGLALFTSILLYSKSTEEYLTRLFEYLDWVYSMQSYSRSYGFIHGALYATLLHQKGFDFSTIKTGDFDLGNAVRELYDIELPAVCRDVAGSLAVNYDIDVINKEEEKRISAIRSSIEKQISRFTERPVVFLELESPYFDFEPEDIHPLDTLGTLYNSMRVSDDWGKLTVDKGGCLVSNNFRYLRISAKGLKKDKNRISGEGWQLSLNNNWELVEVNENFFVRNLNP